MRATGPLSAVRDLSASPQLSAAVPHIFRAVPQFSPYPPTDCSSFRMDGWEGANLPILFMFSSSLFITIFKRQTKSASTLSPWDLSRQHRQHWQHLGHMQHRQPLRQMRHRQHLGQMQHRQHFGQMQHRGQMSLQHRQHSWRGRGLVKVMEMKLKRLVI
jgi:hypothetical protein